MADMRTSHHFQLLVKALALAVLGAALMALGWPLISREYSSDVPGVAGKLLFGPGVLLLGAGLMTPYRRPMAGAILSFFVTAVVLGSYNGGHLLTTAILWIAIFAVYAGIIVLLRGPGKSPVKS